MATKRRDSRATGLVPLTPCPKCGGSRDAKLGDTPDRPCAVCRTPEGKMASLDLAFRTRQVDGHSLRSIPERPIIFDRARRLFDHRTFTEDTLLMLEDWLQEGLGIGRNDMLELPLVKGDVNGET